MAFVSAFEPYVLGNLYLGKLDLKTELTNPEGGGPGFWGEEPVRFGVKTGGHDFYYPLLPRFSRDGTCYFAELSEDVRSEHEAASVSWWKLAQGSKVPTLVSNWSEVPQANYVMPDRKQVLYLEPIDDRELVDYLPKQYLLLHHGDNPYLPLGKNLYLFNPRTGHKESIGEEGDEPVISPTLAPLPKDSLVPPGWFYFIIGGQHSGKRLYKVKADGTLIQLVKQLSHTILYRDFVIDYDVTKIYYLGYQGKEPARIISESLVTGSYRYLDWNCSLDQPIFSADGSRVYLESFFNPPALAQLELATDNLVQLPLGIRFSSQYSLKVKPLCWRLDGSIELLLDIYHRPSNTKQFRYYRYSPGTNQFSLEHSGDYRGVTLAVVDERLTKRALLKAVKSPRSPQWVALETRAGSRNYLAYADPAAFSPDGQWLAFRLWNCSALFVEYLGKPGHLHQVWDGTLLDGDKRQVIFDGAFRRHGSNSREKFAWRSR